MPTINCTICGKVFKSNFFSICNDCIDNEKNNNPYKKVKEYLEKHPGANALQVSEATGVSRNMILKFINDDVVSIVKKNK